MLRKSFLIAILITMTLLTIMKTRPALSTEPGPGAGYATIYLSPESNNFTSPPTVIGNKFTVQIRVHNYSLVAAWQAKLVWDVSLINIPTSADVAYAADFIFPPGSFNPMSPAFNDFNATHRYVIMTCATNGAVEYSGTDAGLMKIDFTIIKEPDPGKTLSCQLWLEPVDTYTTDTNIDENDEDRVDGYYKIASSIPPPPPPPPAKITFQPERTVDATLTPCHSFNVSVKITNGTNVHSLQFKFTFNNTLLTVVDAYPGTFLTGATSTKTINNTEGYVTFGLQLSLSQPPVNGSGTLAIIEFHVESLGETNLTFIEAATWIKDPEGQDLPYETSDGFFSNMMIPKLAVDPPEITDPNLVPPKTFKINITVTEVDGLYDYEFKLGFDPTILACLSIEIHDVLGETNYTPQFSVNNVLGVIWVRVDYYEPAIPISTMTPVALVTITFRVKAMGVTVLDLYDTELSDTVGGLIGHEAHDGLFQSIIRDAAVINVTPQYGIVYEGWIVKINVTVRNEGNLTENIQVKVYYGTSNLIGTLDFLGVAPNVEATLNVTWNTKGVQPCTNYTIWAEAAPLPYETDLSDNTLIDGGVKVKLMGDVNGDKKVDGKDVALIAAAFGTIPGQLRWNPDADLNNDQKIDGKDVAWVAKMYDKSCP